MTVFVRNSSFMGLPPMSALTGTHVPWMAWASSGAATAVTDSANGRMRRRNLMVVIGYRWKIKLAVEWLSTGSPFSGCHLNCRWLSRMLDQRDRTDARLDASHMSRRLKSGAAL